MTIVYLLALFYAKTDTGTHLTLLRDGKMLLPPHPVCCVFRFHRYKKFTTLLMQICFQGGHLLEFPLISSFNFGTCNITLTADLITVLSWPSFYIHLPVQGTDCRESLYTA